MKHYHFIGLGGIGMSALAHILLERQAIVSGSDRASSPILEMLARKGAIITEESAPLAETVTTVVYSTAVNSHHPALVQAKERGLAIIHRAELLRELMLGFRGLLVAGTHGKTTTSSLLTHVLHHSGIDPAFAIGGMIKSLGTNGKEGKGDYFVAEADESDGSFNLLCPWGGIVTNIDNDHLDYWQTKDKLMDGFRHYLLSHLSKEHLFYCIDDPHIEAIEPFGTSYGFSDKAELQVQNFRQEGWQNCFDLRFKDRVYSNICLPLIGGHNVLNAAAVFGLSLAIGISEEEIRNAFLSFEGVVRRADKKGEKGGVLFLDDYAHHPTEIFTTLRAMKKACDDRRLIVVFQPHRYTRTRDCLEDFREAFHPADVLILTDIYSAGEEAIDGINAHVLKEKIAKTYSGDLFFCERGSLASFIPSLMKPKDVIVSMGAGDITKLSSEII